DGSLVAACRTWQLADARASHPPRDLPARRNGQGWIEEDGACGAFFVDDGSGVALVDDDAFDLEAIEGAPSSSVSNGTRALNEGDLVEVIGPAHRAAPPAELVDAGRVDASPLLTFDG